MDELQVHWPNNTEKGKNMKLGISFIPTENTLAFEYFKESIEQFYYNFLNKI